MPAHAATHWRKSSFCSTLRDQGLRPTRQRVQIAELLFAKGDRHLTAETLFAEAREHRYPPSLATIYNALRDFASHGLVREIALYGAKTWYDTKTGPHFHFYLEERDELFDIPEEFIPADERARAQRHGNCRRRRRDPPRAERRRDRRDPRPRLNVPQVTMS